jgi:hypothetical protein
MRITTSPVVLAEPAPDSDPGARTQVVPGPQGLI